MKHIFTVIITIFILMSCATGSTTVHPNASSEEGADQVSTPLADSSEPSGFIDFTVMSSVQIPEDKSYAGPVPVQSGVYLNSRNQMVMVDPNMGEQYSGDGSGYKVQFVVDYERERWSLQVDSNQTGTFDEDEMISGNNIDISELKVIYGKDSKQVAYLVHYDMGYELYVYLGGKSYMIFLEYCGDC